MCLGYTGVTYVGVEYVMWVGAGMGVGEGEAVQAGNVVREPDIYMVLYETPRAYARGFF